MMNGRARSVDEQPTQPYHEDAQLSYGINPPAGLQPEDSSEQAAPAPRTYAPHKHVAAWRQVRRTINGAVIGALAVALAVTVVQLHSMSQRQVGDERTVSQISKAVGMNASQTTQNGGFVSTLRGQINAIQNEVNATSHYGVCLRTEMDNNGFITSVSMTAPVLSNNQDTCPAGTGVFVPVEPGS
jgi:hypothetical protein